VNAELLMLLGGLCAFVLTVYWVRSRDLREKYAVLWLVAASLLLLCGLFPGVIMGFAGAAHLFVSLAAIYIFSFAVSVALSRQYWRNIRLTQEIALLERRLRTMEERALQSSTGLRDEAHCP
jgi:hypothetical membrane protein